MKNSIIWLKIIKNLFQIKHEVLHWSDSFLFILVCISISVKISFTGEYKVFFYRFVSPLVSLRKIQHQMNPTKLKTAKYQNDPCGPKAPKIIYSNVIEIKIKKRNYIEAQSPFAASTVTSAVQSQIEPPCDIWKMKMNKLRSMKTDKYHSLRRPRPLKNRHRLIRSYPKTNIGLRPIKVTVKIAVNAPMILTKPIIVVPRTGEMGKLPPVDSSMLNNSRVAQTLTAFIPVYCMKKLSRIQIYVALRYFAPKTASLKLT